MAAPTIRGTPTAGNSGGNVTSQTIPLPFSDFNDLVVVFVAIDGIVSPTESSGRWSIQTITSSSVTHALCTARQDNSLPDLSLTLVPGANEALSWVAYAVQDTPDYQTDRSSFGSDANPDADSISDGPAHDYLVLSAAAWNGNKSLVSYPTGYSLGQATDRWANANGVGIAAAGREALATAVEDPDPFAISAADDWAAWTVGLTVHVFVTTINPIGISSDALPGVAGLTRGRLIYPAIGIASAVAVGTPTFVPVARILPTGIVTGQALGNPVRLGGRSISPSGITSAEAFGTPRFFVEYGSAVISDAPSAWWRLDEPSGNFIDEINGLIATPTGTPTRSVTSPIRSEPNDKAITVSTTQYLSVPVNTALDLVNGPMTIEAWINLNAYPTSPNTGAIVGKGTNAYMFWVDSTGKLYLSKRFVDDVLTSTGTPIALNTWYHVVAVHNVSVLNKLYVNNVDTPLTFKSTVLLADSASPLGIASEIGGTAAGQFSGTIDEVALYKTTLSAARVAAHYNAGIRSRILADGVASGEIVGNPTLTGLYNLLVTGIASGEIVGNPTLLGLVTLLATAIDSGEAVGDHTVALASAITAIITNGIASGELVGNATLTSLATILTTAINSSEAIGNPTLYSLATIIANGVASGEVVGNATLTALATILATAINSGEVVSNPILTSLATIIANGVSSSEALGSATLLKGTVLILPAGVGGAEALGAALLLPGGVQINPAGVLTGEVIGLPVVGHGGVLVVPSGVSSSEAFGAHVLTSLVAVRPTGISSAEALGLHILSPGGVNIQTTGVPSAESVGSHALTTIANIIVQAIASGEAISTPIVLAGGVTVQVTAVASAEALGTHTLRPGGVQIIASGVTSQEIFGSHVINTGELRIFVNAIASTELFGTPTLTTLAQILASGITSGQAVGNPTFLALASIITSGISSGEAIGLHTLRAVANILPQGVTTSEVVGLPTLASVATIIAQAIQSGELIGSHLITGQLIGYTIAPSGVAGAETFGLPVVQPGPVRILVQQVGSSEAFGAVNLRAVNVVIPPGVGSAEALGLNTITPGGVQIIVAGVPGGEIVAEPILRGAWTITPTGVTSDEALGSTVLLTGYFVRPSSIPGEEAFGLPELQPGEVFVEVVSIDSGEVIGHARVNVGALRTAIQFAYGKGFADTRRRSWPTARDTGDTRTRDWTTAQKKPTATRRH